MSDLKIETIRKIVVHSLEKVMNRELLSRQVFDGQKLYSVNLSLDNEAVVREYSLG